MEKLGNRVVQFFFNKLRDLDISFGDSDATQTARRRQEEQETGAAQAEDIEDGSERQREGSVSFIYALFH